MSRRFRESRRQFLKQAATSVGTAAIAVGAGGMTSRKALAAAGANRRHLINIQGLGGWDSHWFYSTMKPSEAQFTDAQNHTQVKDNNGNVIRTLDNLYTTRFDDKNGVSPYIQHPNYKDPNANVVLGLGMKAVYGGRTDQLTDLSIWRGLAYTDGHGIGNKVLLHGSLSQYALSFSSLTALQLEKDYLRPLHFVQISDSPAALNTNWAMAKGSAVPVNIGNYQAFQDLTKPSTSEFADSTRRTTINDTVARLAKMVSGFQLSSSKTIFNSFLTSFNGAVTVGGSNMALSPEFLAIWKSYVLEMMSTLDGMFPSGGSSDWVGTTSLTVSENILMDQLGVATALATARSFAINTSKWPSGKLTSSIPDISTAKTPDQMAALAVTLSDFIEVRNTQTAAQAPTLALYNSIVDVSFGWAMAYFLVKNDFSAVVDLATFCGDYHNWNDSQQIGMTLTWAALRKLIADLKSCDAGNGKSLLDITTVVMTSEFDRMANLSIESELIHRGTGHGYSSSVILAGYGVQTGKVWGDLKRGPGSTHVSLPDSTGKVTDVFPGIPFTNPLPVDQNGTPTMGATTYYTRYLFPTICRIFGITIPADQITDATYVPFVVKT